jgi:hypothetical protein
MTHKYELYDIYETEVFDCGELLCSSDDMAEIKAAAKERIKDTDGECKLFVREWLAPAEISDNPHNI